MSETNGKSNIYQRINAIMQEIGYIQKDKKNSFMKFNYVSHDAVVSAMRPYWTKHGITVVFDVADHSVRDIQDEKGNNKGLMTSVVAEVTFINVDNPEDKIVVHTIGQGIDKNDLGPGKAMSYAYKYALLKTFALETGDDPENDGTDYKPNGGAKKPEAKPQPTDKTNGGAQPTTPDNDVEKELNKLAVELFNDVNKARRDANKKGFLVFEDFVKAFRKHCVEAKTPGITMKKLAAIRSHREAAINVLVSLE